MAAFERLLVRSAALLLDLVLPPRCLRCPAAVTRQGGLCPSCWSQLTFVTPPLCPVCGTPRRHDDSAGACLGCLALPPRYGRARAALVYDEGSRPLVLGFKHGDQTQRAAAFGAWMARAGAEILAGADLLVPVPLHPWRLFTRRYNQAALLAQAAGRAAGIAVGVDVLVRRRLKGTEGASQGGLGRAGRRRNVRGVFALRPGRTVAGRAVVLVDDVLTTGATADECARVLLRAGAARVDVLTLARVVRAA